jgi:hypothetical protein
MLESYPNLAFREVTVANASEGLNEIQPATLAGGYNRIPHEQDNLIVDRL